MKYAQKIRKSLNDYIKEKGNKIMPHLSKDFDGSAAKAYRKPGFAYGLGDFLTQKITCRKAGAVIGAVTPAIVGYVATKAVGGSGLEAIMTSIMVAPATIFTIPAGYGIGYFLDLEYYKRKDHKKFDVMK